MVALLDTHLFGYGKEKLLFDVNSVFTCNELTPSTSALLVSLIEQHLDRDVVRMVNGAFPDALKVRYSSILTWSLVLR